MHGAFPKTPQNYRIFLYQYIFLFSLKPGLKKKTFKILGFQILRKNRTHSRGGGILILVRNEIKISILNDLNDANGNIEICSIKVKNISPEIEIIVCYRPARRNELTQEDWDTTINNIKNNSHCILLRVSLSRVTYV